MIWANLLAVVEACRLRYLFPLSSFAVLVGYLPGPVFKVALVMATIPVTTYEQPAAITGVLVNTFGNEVAEAFCMTLRAGSYS